MIFENVLGFFQGLINSIPEGHRLIFSLFLYTILIVVYSVFIWKFYRFMAERDIIKLNLKQYSNTERPGLGKFYEVLLSTFEYLIILPFLVLFWFSVFSIFFLLLSENQSAEQILLITTAIIASTRVTAYISQNLSKDIAKIFPFTVLVLFLLDPNFFKISSFFDKIIQIPTLFDKVLVFVIFIFIVEFTLRIIYSLAAVIHSSDS